MTKINAPIISVLEQSKARRVPYKPKAPLRDNLVLKVDSYKFNHWGAYNENVVGMFSYIEARTNGTDIIVPFGRQAELQKLLSTPITKADVDEAEVFADIMVSEGTFNREAWDYILERYNGYIPLQIRGVPEGTPVASGNIIVSIMCIDEYVSNRISWLASYFETTILRGEWYGSTIASNDYKARKILIEAFEETGAPKEMLPWMLHCFGARGTSSPETAQIGGAAHLVNFMGSDTVEGIRYANYYYDEPMSAYSVRATEHSVQCSYQVANGYEAQGEEIVLGDANYLKSIIKNLGQKGKLLSIVIDGFNVYKATEILCSDEVKQMILDIGCTVVFRPDSGNMFDIVPWILDMQAEAYGYDVNELGYKKVRTVGIIQGDGINLDSMQELLDIIVARGYRADSVVFGSGGALLQKVNRDTYKYAQKASAVLIRNPENGDTDWVGIAKNPITDQGKASKKGVLSLFRNKNTGEYATIRIDQGSVEDEWVDVMEDLYDCGEFFNASTLAEVRARVNS